MPKRSDQRRRRNEPTKPIDKGAGAGSAEPPAADEKWHPVARAWYESLAESGQSGWYQPSDWATAVLVAESMSRDLKPQFVGVNEATGEVLYETIPLKGASLSAYRQAMATLLVTEGDRRRASLELQRNAAAPESSDEVVSIDDYRRRLAGAG